MGMRNNLIDGCTDLMNIHFNIPTSLLPSTDLGSVVFRILFDLFHRLEVLILTVVAEQVSWHIGERKLESEGLHGRLVFEFAKHLAKQSGSGISREVSELDFHECSAILYGLRGQDSEFLAFFLDLLELFLGLFSRLHLGLDDDDLVRIINVCELDHNFRHCEICIYRVVKGNI